MRLTPAVVREAPTYLNPVKEREISLRGLNAVVIENLGITEDLYECIDLSNNQFVKIDNIPPLPRLKTLLLSNNNISKISSSVCKSLPSLTSLVLINNSLSDINEIANLAGITTLENIYLLNNPISTQLNYRIVLKALFPNLKLIDGMRITSAEDLKSKYIKVRIDNGSSLVELIKTKLVVELTPEHQDIILQKIEAATTAEEVEYLEQIVLTGNIPDDFKLE